MVLRLVKATPLWGCGLIQVASGSRISARSSAATGVTIENDKIKVPADKSVHSRQRHNPMLQLKSSGICRKALVIETEIPYS